AFEEHAPAAGLEGDVLGRALLVGLLEPFLPADRAHVRIQDVAVGVDDAGCRGGGHGWPPPLRACSRATKSRWARVRSARRWRSSSRRMSPARSASTSSARPG